MRAVSRRRAAASNAEPPPRLDKRLGLHGRKLSARGQGLQPALVLGQISWQSMHPMMQNDFGGLAHAGIGFGSPKGGRSIFRPR